MRSAGLRIAHLPQPGTPYIAKSVLLEVGDQLDAYLTAVDQLADERWQVQAINLMPLDGRPMAVVISRRMPVMPPQGVAVPNLPPLGLRKR